MGRKFVHMDDNYCLTIFACIYFYIISHYNDEISYRINNLLIFRILTHCLRNIFLIENQIHKFAHRECISNSFGKVNLCFRNKYLKSKLRIISNFSLCVISFRDVGMLRSWKFPRHDQPFSIVCNPFGSPRIYSDGTRGVGAIMSSSTRDLWKPQPVPPRVLSDKPRDLTIYQLF